MGGIKMDMLKLCKNCREKLEEPFYGYISFVNEEDFECPICRNKLINTNITIEDYQVIDSISDDITFLEAMIELKKKDPIEYQLKMSQFKVNLKQQESSKKVEEDNRPKCPTCGSTNIEKISLGKKAVGGALFGLFSSNVRKSMHCKSCGYKW